MVYLGRLYFSRFDSISAYYYSALFVKLLAGLALGFLFRDYYGFGDTLVFFQEGEELASLEWSPFWESVTAPTISSQPVRAIYFVRGVAILVKLTHADYWLASIYCSLISFFGSFYLVGRVSKWKPMWSMPVLISFLFFPSVVFWTSGLLKESVAFGSMCYLLGLYFSFLMNRRLTWQQLALGMMALLTFSVLKYYVAAVFLPLICYLLVYDVIQRMFHWKNKFWLSSLLVFVLLLVPIIGLLSWLSPNLTYQHFWRVVSENHDLFLEKSAIGTIEPIALLGGWIDGFINLVYYTFSGLFRPLVGEVTSATAIIASIENAFLLILSLVSIRRLVWTKIVWSPQLLATIMYVFFLALFLSYSVPSFGTLARFKVYFIPFFLLMILIPLRGKKIV